MGCKSQNWQSNDADLNKNLFFTFCNEKDKKQKIMRSSSNFN